MYSYLTGSASWFILTLLTQAFGVYGRDGQLVIEPKLAKEQFQNSTNISISRNFAGRRLQVNFLNPGKLEYGRYKIVDLRMNSKRLPVDKASSSVIIRKTTLSNLPVNRLNTVDIILG
jgi:cellobiose phosphorylase